MTVNNAGTITTGPHNIALQELGDGTRAIPIYEAQGGNTAAFGETLSAQNSPKAAWRFDYGVNTRLVTTTTANGGTVTAVNSFAKLQTTTNAAGRAVVRTLRRFRYLPGMGGLVRFTAVFDTPKANSKQYIGIGDDTDGFFIGYNGLQFGVLRRRAGGEDWIYAASWNGNLNLFTPQFGNVYQIRFQWLGFGSIRFYCSQPNAYGRFVALHTIFFQDTSTTTSILNPTLPITAEVINSGNDTNLTLLSPSACAFLEGHDETPSNPMDIYNSFDATATFADTNNNHLVTVRNKSTFNSIDNRIPVQLRSINISRSSAGAATSTVRLYRNATTAGALSYTDIDATNSPADASITTTTVTSASAERAYTVSDASTSQLIQFLPGEFVLNPGDSVNVGVQNSGVQSTLFVVTLNWVEQF